MSVNYGKKLRKKIMKLDVWAEGVATKHENIDSSKYLIKRKK
jgi:hypothetical protein